MARLSFLLLILMLEYSLGAQNICLYSGASKTVLKPLQLKTTDCPKNTSYCMNAIYNYNNFQYGGVASLKPQQGEAVSYLTQDANGILDFVSMMNTNIKVTSTVWVNIVGAAPTSILLEDDPQDTWLWDPSTNTGNFSWTTQPTYTDGVVIGHINFINNYCLRTTFTQSGSAISKVSILSGTVASPVRVISVNYTSGQLFEFCQYPVTAQSYQNATCPALKNGAAQIWIVFGPATVQYSWYNSANQLIGSNQNITGLGAGTYTVLINDTSNANGCNAQRTITIYDLSLYSPTVTTTNFACTTKGSASATPNGGASGLTYQWFNAATGILVGTGSTIGNLNIGNYYVQVTDSCNSVAYTNLTIVSIGCCGDGMCSTNETCSSAQPCAADCGPCCPAGTYISGSSCVVCPPGTFGTTAQATSCTTCPANTYTAGGSGTCVPCPANYYSASGAGVCLRCAAGTVRDTNDTSCSTCGVGSYAPACDSSQCMSCPAGTFGSSDGVYQCNSCAPGSYSAAGQPSCNSCPANTYSLAAASSCSNCPLGLSSPAGSTHPLMCN